jgi:hypothetical protein
MKRGVNFRVQESYINDFLKYQKNKSITSRATLKEGK